MIHFSDSKVFWSNCRKKESAQQTDNQENCADTFDNQNVTADAVPYTAHTIFLIRRRIQVRSATPDGTLV
jgi:hypothetical protein